MRSVLWLENSGPTVKPLEKRFTFCIVQQLPCVKSRLKWATVKWWTQAINCSFKKWTTKYDKENPHSFIWLQLKVITCTPLNHWSPLTYTTKVRFIQAKHLTSQIKEKTSTSNGYGNLYKYHNILRHHYRVIGYKNWKDMNCY